MENKQPQPDQGMGQDRVERRPYRKPSFRYERVFETMALSCGKIDATQSQCKFNKKVS